MTFHRIVTFLSAGAIAYFAWSAAALLEDEPTTSTPVASSAAPRAATVSFVPAPLSPGEAHAVDEVGAEASIDADVELDTRAPTDGPRGLPAGEAEAAFSSARSELERAVAAVDPEAPLDAAARRRLRDRAMRALVEVAPYLTEHELGRRVTDVRAQLAQLEPHEHVHFDE